MKHKRPIQLGYGIFKCEACGQHYATNTDDNNHNSYRLLRERGSGRYPRYRRYCKEALHRSD